MFGSIKKFNQFDKVTEFRLINAFLVSIGLSLLAPLIITLKGTLMLAWIISVFAILNMLAVKTNDFIVEKFTLDQLYKIGIITHILLILSAGLFYWSPLLMIWLDSSIVIIETAVFSSYSIMLTNYLTDNYPNDMKKFQIVRNSSWADGALAGLGIITLVTFFFPLSYAIGAFIIFNLGFSIWMVKNWNFFDYINKDI